MPKKAEHIQHGRQAPELLDTYPLFWRFNINVKYYMIIVIKLAFHPQHFLFWGGACCAPSTLIFSIYVFFGLALGLFFNSLTTNYSNASLTPSPVFALVGLYIAISFSLQKFFMLYWGTELDYTSALLPKRTISQLGYLYLLTYYIQNVVKSWNDILSLISKTKMTASAPL